MGQRIVLWSDDEQDWQVVAVPGSGVAYVIKGCPVSREDFATVVGVSLLRSVARDIDAIEINVAAMIR